MPSSNPWWYFYEFLKLSDRAKWSAGVTRDFAGIEDQSWEEWWEEWGESLQPQDLYTVVELRSVDDYEPPIEGTGAPELTVRIQLWRPRAEIDAALKKLIDARIGKSAGGAGRFIGWTVGGEYHLGSKPDVQALDNYLNAYKLNQEREAARPGAPQSMYDIGVRLGIGAHTVRQGDQGSEGKTSKVVAAKKQAMTKLVDNYLRKARYLIAGVEKGLFPATDDHPVDPTTY